MNTNEKFKSLIKKKLTKDLSHAEIILGDDGSIWLIDRENTYWYLEFEKSGKLWWRYQFFTDFFKFFSMERSEYEPIIVEWVEDVLNGKVVSSAGGTYGRHSEVEDVLNGKVVSSMDSVLSMNTEVEDVLNGKVVSSQSGFRGNSFEVEDVLNGKVVSSAWANYKVTTGVEDVLNGKVVSSLFVRCGSEDLVEEVLNKNNQNEH